MATFRFLLLKSVKYMHYSYYVYTYTFKILCRFWNHFCITVAMVCYFFFNSLSHWKRVATMTLWDEKQNAKKRDLEKIFLVIIYTNNFTLFFLPPIILCERGVGERIFFFCICLNAGWEFAYLLGMGSR